MKPTRTHYFYAADWPLKICTTIVFIIASVLVIRACQIDFNAFRDPLVLLWLLFAIVLALPVGWLVAIVVLWPFLGSLLWSRACQNGAPFQPGDRVRILAKSNRDHVTHVYSKWQGDTVRVDLGEEAKAKYKDIFQSYQLLREEDVTQ